jgi:hypothetical protein
MHLSVDRLRLRFANAAGHEHRMRPITRRALELLHLRLREELLAAGVHLESLSLDTLVVPPMNLDLGTLSDDGVAQKVAETMYTALRTRWQEG